jgi:NhaP-type Na+/H+ or K+/H+ antiporter
MHDRRSVHRVGGKVIDRPTAAIALAVAVGVGCQLAAHRWRFPSIILLLVAGLVAGPGLDLIDPDALFGDLLFPAVSAAVALLLFEGGLSLRLREVGGLRVTLLRLLTVGASPRLSWGRSLLGHWVA